MPLTHLLDTSVFCQPLKPKPLPSVQARWSLLGDEALAVSVICEAELLYGLELKGSVKLKTEYEQLLKGRLHSFPVDSSVGINFAQVKSWAKKNGHICSDCDFLIAATAKAHGLILATLNYRHFQGIEGLAVEDWAK